VRTVLASSHNTTYDLPLHTFELAKPTVLLAGEESFVGLLKYVLEHDNFVCHYAKDGSTVPKLAEKCRPDLIALDSTLGQTAALARQQLSINTKTREIPVVMLISAAEDIERLKIHSAEPTDYLLKSVVPGKLIARLRSILQPSASIGVGGIINFHDIRMDVKAHRIFRNKREIHVGPIEFRLLQHLMSYPCQAFSRRQLLECVWGRDIHVTLRTVDVHMSRLRKALNGASEDNYIRTVRGVGYSLDV
jgi:two-component system phosphate regulon response regulator PhoB